MSTLEKTMAMIQPLSDKQLVFIQELVERFSRQEKVDNPYKPMSEAEFLDALSVARKHADDGMVKEAGAVYEEMRQKYGL